MIPLPSLLIIRIVAAIVAVVAVFGAGWKVRGWQADAEISQIHLEQAKTEADQARQALATIEQATETINAAAKRYGAVQSNLSLEIADLKKELQNEKPLPVDCVPSAGRVRSLDAAINAANKASSTGQPAR